MTPLEVSLARIVAAAPQADDWWLIGSVAARLSGIDLEPQDVDVLGSRTTIEAFARNLGRLTDIPLLFWDERLSTVAAERTLIEMDFSRKKRETKIDSAAAAFILQGVLDRLRSLRRPAPE